jgi:tetratricopeptide (TPR) repeat protein
VLKNERFSVLCGAMALGALVLSAAACQSSLVRAVAFWRHPAVAQAAPPGADPVRNAFLRETEGAYDPRTGEQVQTLESRLKMTPQDAVLHVELGRAYETYSIDDLALEQFTRALNLDPNSLDALQGLTRLARKHSEQLSDLVPVALAFTERYAIEHHGSSAAVLSTVGSILDDSGDLPTAEKLYRQALELEPKAPWLHNNLGFNLLLQGRAADAAAELRRSLQLNPGSEVARNNLGVALARQGDTQGALRVFQETGADRAAAHNNLAVALLEQDRLEESRAELLEALKAKNFFEPALENFKLLLERDQDRQDSLAARPFLAPVDQPFRLPAPREWMRTWQPPRVMSPVREPVREEDPRSHP